MSPTPTTKPPTPLNLRPPTKVHYPPFKNGRYFEEYFYDYWHTTQAANNKHNKQQRLLYIDIFWHNVFHHYQGGAASVVPLIAPGIQQLCQLAKQRNMIPFTICQWDDGPCLGDSKPDNLVVFSLGQSKDVAMPLIVEDTTEKLLRLPRLPYAERDITCSFVGSLTHPCRCRMLDALAGINGFVLHGFAGWRIDVPQNMADLFVDVTQRSKFALAPRGYGPSSFRFFEIAQLGVVPVYVHDGDNALPFRDVLDYTKFAIVIHIDDIAQLPAMLSAISEAQYTSMLQELDAVTSQHFSMQGACENVMRILANHQQYR